MSETPNKNNVVLNIISSYIISSCCPPFFTKRNETIYQSTVHYSWLISIILLHVPLILHQGVSSVVEIKNILSLSDIFEVCCSFCMFITCFCKTIVLVSLLYKLAYCTVLYCTQF